MLTFRDATLALGDTALAGARGATATAGLDAATTGGVTRSALAATVTAADASAGAKGATLAGANGAAGAALGGGAGAAGTEGVVNTETTGTASVTLRQRANHQTQVPKAPPTSSSTIQAGTVDFFCSVTACTARSDSCVFIR